MPGPAGTRACKAYTVYTLNPARLILGRAPSSWGPELCWPLALARSGTCSKSIRRFVTLFQPGLHCHDPVQVDETGNGIRVGLQREPALAQRPRVEAPRLLQRQDLGHSLAALFRARTRQVSMRMVSSSRAMRSHSVCGALQGGGPRGCAAFWQAICSTSREVPAGGLRGGRLLLPRLLTARLLHDMVEGLPSRNGFGADAGGGDFSRLLQ